MRKASKAVIAANLKVLQTLKADWESKLAALNQSHIQYIREWIADLESRVVAGECTRGHACTAALAASIVRDIRAWESGYYKGLTENGGRMVA